MGSGGKEMRRIWKLGWGRVECERRDGTEGTGVIGLGTKTRRGKWVEVTKRDHSSTGM